jgi:DNA-binding MarR family transcriptional regulator
MVLARNVPQSSLVRVLQPLLAAGALIVERRYVANFSRRMKVYRLTQLGSSAARDLQPRRPEAVATKERGGWVG